jgi:hypothetical protein
VIKNSKDTSCTILIKKTIVVRMDIEFDEEGE